VYRLPDLDSSLFLYLIDNKPVVLENLVQGQVAGIYVLRSDLLVLANLSA
jgi:hypothetical protein